MNEQVTSVIVGVVGLYVLKLAGDFFATFLKRRIFEGPEKSEQGAAAKLDQVLEKTSKIESDVRVLVVNLEAHKETVSHVASRLEGISKNYGERLGVVEEKVTRVDERNNVIDELERVLAAPRKRRRSK